MKIYLQNLVKDLVLFSQSLDKQSIIINKPWALIDSDLGIQKLIFEKNNNLILSRDGQVQDGQWRYLAEAKCLIIDRGHDKILCNEIYIDESILVLKNDGVNGNFIILANENKIPDLDAYGYLQKLYQKKYGVLVLPLIDDKSLYIKPEIGSEVLIGSSAKLDNKNTPDGVYITKNGKCKYIVKNNKIESIIYFKTYLLDDNRLLTVEQLDENIIDIGSKVTINGEDANDCSFFLDDISVRVYIRNSLVSYKTYYKNYILNDKTTITIEQFNENKYSVGDIVFRDGCVVNDGEFEVVENACVFVEDGKIGKLAMSRSQRITYIIALFVLVFSVITALLI